MEEPAGARAEAKVAGNQVQVPVIQTSDPDKTQIQQNTNKVLRNLHNQIDTLNNTAFYSGGFQNGSNTVYWQNAGAQFSDFTAIGTPELTENLNMDFGTISAADLKLPGIKLISAPFSGLLELMVSSGSGVMTDNTSVELVDGDNNFIKASSSRAQPPLPAFQFFLTGYYEVIAKKSYTFKVRSKTITPTFFIGGSAGMQYLLDFSLKYVK